MPKLLIDLDGVIYDGGEAVTGAADALAWLRENGFPYVFVTNTTSRPRIAIVNRLERMGIRAAASDILTPPVAATGWLEQHVEGPVALFVPPATASEFARLPIADPASADPVGAVVVGDYGEDWSFAELNRAFRLLMQEPRPALVALGMTRYWRSPDGLRLDTAPFVIALSHASGADPVVLGKPAAPFFEAALEFLDASAGDTLMIGDDIRTDIDAAQRLGIRGVLVRTGKFRPDDLALGIEPHLILNTFADLPEGLSNA